MNVTPLLALLAGGAQGYNQTLDAQLQKLQIQKQQADQVAQGAAQEYQRLSTTPYFQNLPQEQQQQIGDMYRSRAGRYGGLLLVPGDNLDRLNTDGNPGGDTPDVSVPTSVPAFQPSGLGTFTPPDVPAVSVPTPSPDQLGQFKAGDPLQSLPTSPDDAPKLGVFNGANGQSASGRMFGSVSEVPAMGRPPLDPAAAAKVRGEVIKTALSLAPGTSRDSYLRSNSAAFAGTGYPTDASGLPVVEAAPPPPKAAPSPEELRADGVKALPDILGAAARQPLPMQAATVRTINQTYGLTLPVPGETSSSTVQIQGPPTPAMQAAGQDRLPPETIQTTNPALSQNPQDLAALAQAALDRTKASLAQPEFAETVRHDQADEGTAKLGIFTGAATAAANRASTAATATAGQAVTERGQDMTAATEAARPGSNPNAQYVAGQQARLNKLDTDIQEADRQKNQAIVGLSSATDDNAKNNLRVIAAAQNNRILAAQAEQAAIRKDIARFAPSPAINGAARHPVTGQFVSPGVQQTTAAGTPFVLNP